MARAAKTKRLSIRAFAARIGVSHPAVRKGIASGRLSGRSLGRDARGPYVADVALAKRQWKAGASKPANGGGRKARGAGDPAAGTLVAAHLRLADQRADALELANRRKRGEVLDAGDVEREHFQIARTVRERVLNVPDRLPDLDRAIRARLIAALREALLGLADELEHE